MSKELGNKLKVLRNNIGFTQKQIAEQLNVDRSTYSNYERAVTEPDVKTLIKLAKVFGVEVGELLSSGERLSKVAEPTGMYVYNLSKEEKSFIIRYRLLNEEQRGKTSNFIDKFLILEE